MSDKSWISRLFGRGNKEDGSPRSSASNSPLSRSPRLLSDANTRIQESSAGVNGCLSGTSPPTSSRNVMYFSPESALGQRTDVTSSVFNTRKRQLTDFGSPESNVLASARVKRFREGLGNSSLMEAPEKSNLGLRLDATWAPGQMGQMSPASSNQSLRSRISLASTVHTNLSSKTRAILEKLEKVSSPATVVMRMPFPKSSNSGPERWAPSANGSNNSSVRSFGSASGAPPLRRQTLNAPSRLEVLSSSTAPLYKKPYWRDLSRSQIKPSVVDGAVGTPSKDVQRVQSSQPVKVSPLFDLSVGSPALKESEKLPESEPVRRHLPPIKGSDGKSTRNTFNANELYEEDGADETDAAWLNKSAALPAFSFAAPTKGFLGENIENGVFEFAPPIKRGPKPPSPTSSEESSAGESSESDSGSGSDEESELSEHSEKQAGAQVVVPAKTGDKVTVPVLEKRSQSAITTADSETSASNVPTPASSKNASPQGGAGGSSSSTIAPWDCPECFISNSLGTPKCVACGFVKDKAAAASAPVFGSSAFKVAPTTTSTFAFGVSKPSDAEKNKDSSSQPQGSANAEKTELRQPWFCPDCYITNKDSDDKCIACGHVMFKSAPAPAVERKAWDCPDCFVNNKATDDKCMACGHEMYKSADASAKPTSVFGDKAFKPVAPPSGVSFGFGGKSASTSSNASTASTVSFGIGASKPSGEKEAAAKPLFGFGTSGTTASTIPSFGVPLSTITEEAKKAEEPKASVPSSGTSSLFTSAADAAPKAAAPSVFQGFGAVTSNSALSTAASAPSLSIFGTAATSIKPLTSTTTTTTTTSSSTSTAAPLSVFAFPAGAATSQRSPFSATATTTSTPSSTAPAPLFGSGVAATSSTTNLFGASAPATSANTAVSSSVPLPLFGSSTITSASTATTATAPLFGASATGAGGLFGASKPMFGSGASVPATTASSGGLFEAPSAKRPFAFGNTESTTSQPSSTGMFGSSTDKPAFGAAPAAGSMFGSNATSSSSTTTPFTFGAPAAQPQQPVPATNGGFNFAPTTQTNNMFGSSTASVPAFRAPTEPPAAFNFGGAAAPSTGTFQFGASAPAAGGQPFVFGQSAPAPAAPSFPSFNATAAAPNPSPFGFGAPQESTTDPSPFAYGANPSTSGRKMAQARRRLTRRT